MVALRCTRRLLTRLRADPPSDEIAPSGKLGDWYANVVATRPRTLALCTNERTLLSVVVRTAPGATFLDRFRAAAQARIRQIPVPASLRLAEIGALSDLRLQRTCSRSVLASMNQLGFSAEGWLQDRPNGDLDELGLWLSDTPCFALTTTWPWREAVLLLTGVRPPEIGILTLAGDGM